MKVRRYLVNTMPEAMEAIRRDLGPEAVIISTRQVRSGTGWARWWRPKKLEVTAAVDDQPVATAVAGNYAQLQREIVEIKELLHRSSSLNREDAGLPERIRDWKEVLTRLEINEEIIAQLLQQMTAATGMGSEPDPAGLQDELLRHLAAIFQRVDGHGSPRRILAFIGPTGVGKTTTLAKLAARLAILKGKQVSLVTTDTYRIGATEQLRTYGEIMGLPVEVVMTPREFGQVLERHHQADAILVDTPGRSPQSAVYRRELERYLACMPEADIFLVLSCTTKSSDLLQIATTYQKLGANKLIFTKLDETAFLGSIVNIVEATGLPVSYLAVGQNVPDDLVEAHPEELARRILGVD